MDGKLERPDSIFRDYSADKPSVQAHVESHKRNYNTGLRLVQQCRTALKYANPRVKGPFIPLPQGFPRPCSETWGVARLHVSPAATHTKTQKNQLALQPRDYVEHAHMHAHTGDTMCDTALCYYDSAEDTTISQKRARLEIDKHSADWYEFIDDVGLAAEYDAQVVLGWLGY